MAASKSETLDFTWCFTGPDLDKTDTFHWSIDNFVSRLEESAPLCLKSDPFKINEETFKLVLYPKGDTKENEGFVG